MTPAITAVVLVDFQNEYAKPGGKMHGALAEVMRENGMLQKATQIVEEAR